MLLRNELMRAGEFKSMLTARDVDGCTAAHYAASAGHDDMLVCLRYLTGSNDGWRSLIACDHLGATPKEFLVRSGHPTLRYCKLEPGTDRLDQSAARWAARKAADGGAQCSARTSFTLHCRADATLCDLRECAGRRDKNFRQLERYRNGTNGSDDPFAAGFLEELEAAAGAKRARAQTLQARDAAARSSRA
jgi:hypothetical protein